MPGVPRRPLINLHSRHAADGSSPLQRDSQVAALAHEIESVIALVSTRLDGCVPGVRSHVTKAASRSAVPVGFEHYARHDQRMAILHQPIPA